jgi:hypothetical protein
MGERFIQPDGSQVADGPGVRATVTPRAVAKAWLRETRVIPPQFAVGTALHESSYTLNEIDLPTAGSKDHTTGGIFQLDVATFVPINIGDAAAVGMPDKNIYDLADACAVFAALSERRLRRILDAADLWLADHQYGPLDHFNPPPDVWAYLALAHNQGLGACLKTIAAYGLDWADYKRRNPTVNISMVRNGRIYGDDAIGGGPDWLDEFANPFDEDAAGDEVAIPAPTISAAASSQLRLSLLVLLALLLVYYAMGARPSLKGAFV